MTEAQRGGLIGWVLMWGCGNCAARSGIVFNGNDGYCLSMTVIDVKVERNADAWMDPEAAGPL